MVRARSSSYCGRWKQGMDGTVLEERNWPGWPSCIYLTWQTISLRAVGGRSLSRATVLRSQTEAGLEVDKRALAHYCSPPTTPYCQPRKQHIQGKAHTVDLFTNTRFPTRKRCSYKQDARVPRPSVTPQPLAAAPSPVRQRGLPLRLRPHMRKARCRSAPAPNARPPSHRTLTTLA